MSDTLVSIVVPTWQRNELLRGVLENIAEQTHKNIEVIVVVDGMDEEAHAIAKEVMDPHVEVVELGRNWSSLIPNSFGIAPLTVGYLMTTGEYIMHLSDDDRITPDYVERLLALIEQTDKDFVYTKARFYWHDQTPEEGYDIGTDPPVVGQITSYLFKASNLWNFGMPGWHTHPVDWGMVEGWMHRGAQWAMLDEVLFTHRADDEAGR